MVLFTLWKIGIVLLLARSAASWLWVWSLARRGARIAPGVVELDHWRTPAAFGLWRYTILMPRAAREWPQSRMEAALVHERAHAARKDGLAQMAANVACALHWFNPLVWIASRWMTMEAERACDDRTMAQGIRASDYAGHLVAVARSLRREWLYGPAVVSMRGRTSIERRIRAILATGLRRDAVTRREAAAVAVLAMCVLGPLAALRAQGAGSISGVLYDPAQAAVPNAEMILEGKNGAASIRSGGDGSFLFADVAPGRYRLRIRTPGFAEAGTMVDVAAGATRRLFPQLAIGEITETVDVVADRGAATQAPPPVRTRVGGQVAPARLLAQVRPEYPPAAREAGLGGTVRILATVQTDGTLGSVRVLNSPHADLSAAATKAVSGWKYRPATLNGRPVAVSTGISLTFSLE